MGLSEVVALARLCQMWRPWQDLSEVMAVEVPALGGDVGRHHGDVVLPEHG